MTHILLHFVIFMNPTFLFVVTRSASNSKKKNRIDLTSPALLYWIKLIHRKTNKNLHKHKFQ